MYFTRDVMLNDAILTGKDMIQIHMCASDAG